MFFSHIYYYHKMHPLPFNYPSISLSRQSAWWKNNRNACTFMGETECEGGMSYVSNNSPTSMCLSSVGFNYVVGTIMSTSSLGRTEVRLFTQFWCTYVEKWRYSSVIMACWYEQGLEEASRKPFGRLNPWKQFIWPYHSSYHHDNTHVTPY